MVVLFLVMWMFMIRPQKRRQQERQQMLQNVGPGAEIITAGGVYGTVTDTTDDYLVLEIAPETEIRVARNAVASIVDPTDEVDDEDYEEELEEAEADVEETAAAESARPNPR
jgi:preprotein translocase subunit YajC